MDPASAAATVDALNQGINVVSQQNINRRNRKYAEKMYKQQRADALSDWERQNAYNSPQAQMERFKAAGLNPNLIYGNQSDGPTVRSTQMDVPQSQAPRVEGNIIGTYQDAALRNVQTNNMRLQADNLQAQNELISAQTIATLMGADKTALANEFTRQNFEVALDTSMQKYANLQRQETETLQRIEQKGQMFPYQITKMVTDNLASVQGIELKKAQIIQIGQAIRESISRTTLNEVKQIDQEQQNQLFPTIKEAMETNLLFKKGEMRIQAYQEEIKRLEAKFKGFGLSPTATSDILNAIGAGFGLGKGAKGLTKPSSPNFKQLQRKPFEATKSASKPNKFNRPAYPPKMQ